MIGPVRDKFYELIQPAIGDAVLTKEGEQVATDVRSTRVRLKVYPQETSNIQGRNAIGVGRIKEEPGRVMIEIFSPVRGGIEPIESLAADIVAAVDTKTYPVGVGSMVIWACWAQEVVEEAPYYRVVVFARYSLFHK